MKNNTYYMVLDTLDNGLYYAYARRVSDSDNIKAILQDPAIIAANICSTKKRAGEIVTAWNDAHKQNNNSVLDKIPF